MMVQRVSVSLIDRSAVGGDESSDMARTHTAMIGGGGRQNIFLLW